MIYGKRVEDLATLGRSPLLRALSMRDLGAFLELLDQVALAPGTTIFREGDTREFMYFVLEGSGRLRRGRLELRALVPGDHFGELAIVDDGGRSTTVEAHTEMRLARLSRSRYRSLANNRPQVALALTQAVAKSLGDELVAFTDTVGLLAHQRSAPRRMQVRIRRGGEDLIVPTGTLAGALLPKEHDGALVVGATLNRKPIGLESAVVADGELAPLTLATWEGRAVYARSAGLVVLEAARRLGLSPEARIGAVLENGLVLALPEDHDRESVAARLLTEVRCVIDEDVPLREEIWSIDEARGDLAAHVPDVEPLLANRRESTTTVARGGGTFAIGMGPLLPRAGYIGAVEVSPHPHGALLKLADLAAQMPKHAGVRADPAGLELVRPRYSGEMKDASRRWLESLGVTTVGGFDEQCVTGGVSELIRVAEGFHEKWIGKIADAILGRRERLRIVAVAGPSSSGKTTFIKRLVVQLLVNGLRPVALSLDDYYVDRERTVRDEQGEYDFEAVEAIDRELLHDHVRRLLAGEEVQTARYDFNTGKSAPAGGKRHVLHEGEVLLLEGIHALSPALLEGAGDPDAIFRVFIHPAQTLSFDRLSVLAPEDVRLLRRLVRDRRHRNYSAADTIMRWPSVRRGELRHIFPSHPFADMVFDSSLVYELSVLKTYAERYLLEVPAAHPASTVAYRLRRLLDQFVAIHPDHVPPTSVIREFIDGSGFEY